MSSPIIFIFNMRRSVYQTFGTSHFNQIKQLYKNIHLLPIVNNLDDGIEARANKIKAKLPLLMDRLKTDKAHLVSYSVSGLDTRFAISQLGMGKGCKSLTTISTPHLGSKMANYSQQNLMTKAHMQPIARLLGIGIKPFHQTVPSNMQYFNSSILNNPTTKYFSIGSQRMPTNNHFALKHTGNYLRLNTKKNFTYENDGVFGGDEIVWGEHLVNFQADHAEVVGVALDLKRIQTFQLVTQNVEAIQQLEVEQAKRQVHA